MNPRLPSHFTQDPQLSLSSPFWSSYLSDLLMAWRFQFYSLFISHDGWHLLARVLKVFNKSYGFGTQSGTGKNEVLRCPSSTRDSSCVRRSGAKEAGEKAGAGNRSVSQQPDKFPGLHTVGASAVTPHLLWTI